MGLLTGQGQKVPEQRIRGGIVRKVREHIGFPDFLIAQKPDKLGAIRFLKGAKGQAFCFDTVHTQPHINKKCRPKPALMMRLSRQRDTAKRGLPEALNWQESWNRFFSMINPPFVKMVVL